jgi:hypothetical protein
MWRLSDFLFVQDLHDDKLVVKELGPACGDWRGSLPEDPR